MLAAILRKLRNCAHSKTEQVKDKDTNLIVDLDFARFLEIFFSVKLINAILMCNILCLITPALLLKGGKGFTVQHFTVSFAKGYH